MSETQIPKCTYAGILFVLYAAMFSISFWALIFPKKYNYVLEQ
jgi:hypothetical protein